MPRHPVSFYVRRNLVSSKDKGKFHHTTGHEDPEGECRYSSTLSFSSALCGGGLVVKTTPRPLYPQERPGTHCIGGWVGPRAGLEGCEKSRLIGIRSQDRPARIESLYRLSYRGPLLVRGEGRNHYCTLITIRGGAAFMT